MRVIRRTQVENSVLVEVGETLRRHLREIVTGGEGRTAPFDHQHAHGLVGRDRVERAQHLVHHRLRQRVAAFRTVQHEPGDSRAALELHGVVGSEHDPRLTGDFSRLRRRAAATMHR